MSADRLDGDYSGRRVLVTGHTGFLGVWTVRWLAHLGAEVAGYSRGQRPVTPWPAGTDCSFTGDVADGGSVAMAMARFEPEIVLHLAGSTIVAAAYRAPMATLTSNFLGTAAVLDAAVRQPSVRSVVVMGTPATAPLGDDLELGPYAASKLSAEAAVAAYAHPRTQEAAGRKTPLAVGVARPGVMLGGDWAEGRLLADVVRAVQHDQPVTLGAPFAVRPWQHVLDGISGALTLAVALAAGPLPRRRYDFGSLAAEPGHRVCDVVSGFLAAYGRPRWPVRLAGDGSGDRLELGCAAARAELGWQPTWTLPEVVDASARWYLAAGNGPAASSAAMDELITSFASRASLAWARATPAVARYRPEVPAD